MSGSHGNQARIRHFDPGSPRISSFIRAAFGLATRLCCLTAIGFPMPMMAPSGQEPDTPTHGTNLADPGIDPDSSLRSRIGPPDPEVVRQYTISGVSGFSDHPLSDDEQSVVDAALARLPELNRRILQRHLKRLTFLNLKPGSGNALMSEVDPEENSKHFAITLRASLIGETLSEFLTTKEATLFKADGSGYRVQFNAGATDALTYILLHESSHIIDMVLGLATETSSPLMAGAWSSLQLPAEPHGSSLAMRNRFRGSATIPIGDAPDHYRALSETPFVSFYATANAREYVAEMFAWQELATRFQQELTLSVLDDAGRTVFEYEPLASPSVKARFLAVKAVVDGAAAAPTTGQ